MTAGGDALFLRGDVRHEQDVVAAIDAAVASSEALDFLVNNAGILGEGRLHETTNELWDDLVATHLTGTFWGCKHAIAAMRESGRGGSIVNIGSILSFTGDGYLAAYTAMKSGVLGLTKAIAIDYALDGIRCNCVCPGDMETPMIEQYFDGTEPRSSALGDGGGLPGQADRRSPGSRGGGIYLSPTRRVRERHADPRRRRADGEDLLRRHAMKFSYVTLPDYPLAESLEHVKTADELGFLGCYAADETWHKDPYVLFAAAADKTKQIRFGPSLAPIALREPTLVCQTIATLDDSPAAMDCVIAIGNFSLPAQYGMDWSGDEAAVPHEGGAHGDAHLPRRGSDHVRGRLLQLHRSVHIRAARAERVPLLIGALRGPSPSRRQARYSTGRTPSRSTRASPASTWSSTSRSEQSARRGLAELDIAAWEVFAVAPDSANAKLAAQTIGAFYIPAMHAEQLERHGIRKRQT